MYDLETDILSRFAVGCRLSHSCRVLSTVVTEEQLLNKFFLKCTKWKLHRCPRFFYKLATSHNHGFYSNSFEEDFTAGNRIPKILTDSNKANHSENPQKTKDPG